MTPEQQLQQLLTEAEQVTAKMREALRHLPDYQPQPKLATTYKEVAEAVRPRLVCDVNGCITDYGVYNYALPNKQAFKQDRAFIQIKNLEAYCANRFEGEMHCSIIVLNGNLCKDYKKHAPFHFSKEAADFVIQHFPEIFKTYYGVK